MKKITQYLAAALLLVITLISCSPERFEGAVQSELPTISGVDFTLEVDQEINQITAIAPELNGFYPVWIINEATYSTLSTVNWSNKTAGTYTIELFLGNRNGVSQASVKKTFTFDRTLVNWGPYYDRLNGKEWRIMSEEAGHLACGTPGSSGSDWWSAMPEEKEEFGVYDDRMVFTFGNKGDDKGTYTYHPGEGGTMYVNKDAVTVFPDQRGNPTADFTVMVETQKTTFTLESGTWVDSEGEVQDCVYLVFPAETQFPYISNDEMWANPRLRIEHITAKRIDLVSDNGNIAWHYILSSEEPGSGADEDIFKGYTYDSECNMWRGMTYTIETYFAPGWVANPEGVTIKSEDNKEFNISLHEATADQWQAQVKLLTDLSTNAATSYDFSAQITATETVNGATVKLVKRGDDGVFFFEERIDLAASETYYLVKDNMAGIDMAEVSLVFDFGGAPAGTEIQVSEVVLKEHNCDDGAGHPVDKAPLEYDTDDNEWKAVDEAEMDLHTFYANADWAPLPISPEVVRTGSAYSISLPLATVQQWQAQVALQTYLSCKKDDIYDFGCIVKSNVDLHNVTFKLVKHGGGDNDNIFFFVNQYDFAADEETVIKILGSVAPDDMERISLFFDFGGNPEETQVTIKDIVFRKVN
ncbi:MAG: hypothetical protein Q4D93_00265 [Porphyromonas sp.]|nr:hypothetical protein [Porphyromonas sp.]